MLILQIAAIVAAVLAPLTESKVYNKCELARELSEIHGVSSEDLAIFTCIAEHQSNFNSAAVGQGMYYGMFQMSSEFWCDTYYSNGKACGVDCDNLIDDDLSDDLQCMRTIIDEHERISGNGFNAWPSGASCQSIKHSYLAECSIESNQIIGSSQQKNNQQQIFNRKKSGSVQKGEGKVYERCELARELRYHHNLPSDQIATWVCIAKHESNFNTSAIGRLNWDGSEDHGLFQISDIYWCGGNNGKGCELSCEDLRDNDIANDVECIQKIHTEHTRLFGDGFQAWAVYPRCKGQSEDFIQGCFDDSSNEILPIKPKPGVFYHHENKISSLHKTAVVEGGSSSGGDEGKVYGKCELALELRDVHKIPIDQIATWVCIAKHESNFNTSAIGRLNWDGSEDHGLFQISDIYWCGSNGKACNAQCAEFRDNDISNDIQCIKQIHAEHTRLSGDGFNAWTVYKPKCKGKSKDYINGCFDDDSSNEILPIKPRPGIQQQKITYGKINSNRRVAEKVKEKGKIYERCELAQELRYKFKIPMEQVSTWVCIAKQESNYDTSAIGRLNADGSLDHGLFQISDLFWCSVDGRGKGCDLACSELEDSDITNDVECMLKIHEEHTYLSGDGFNAWTTYSRCKGQSEDYIQGCFTDNENFIQNIKPGVFQPATHHPITVTKSTWKEPPTTTTSYETTQETTTYDPITTKPKTTTQFYKSKGVTEKPLKSSQKSSNDIKQQQFKNNAAAFNKSPSSSSVLKMLSSNVPKTTINKEINGQKNLQQVNSKAPVKTTTAAKKIKTTTSSTTMRISQTTSTKPPKNLKSSTVINNKKVTTRKPATTAAVRAKPSSFDIFAFYLSDFTSKPSINYKPIEFDSKKSTVIINNKNKNDLVHQQQSTREKSSTTTQKPQIYTTTTTKTTTKSLTKAPYYPFNYYDSGKYLSHNRVGRVVGNITPHSIDYLLNLTTPRTFYG